MDPNQNQTNTNSNPAPQVPPNPATPPAAPPVAPPAPPPAQPSQAGQPSFPAPPGSNGKVIIFIVVGIILLVVLGLTYFIAQQMSLPGNQPIPTPTQVPTPTLTPTPTPLSEKDIDTIDLGNPEADLKIIEDDLRQL